MQSGSFLHFLCFTLLFVFTVTATSCKRTAEATSIGEPAVRLAEKETLEEPAVPEGAFVLERYSDIQLAEDVPVPPLGTVIYTLDTLPLYKKKAKGCSKYWCIENGAVSLIYHCDHGPDEPHSH